MGEEEDEYTKSTSKLRDKIKGMTGFDIMKDENTFKDIYDIVVGIGEVWGDLTDTARADLLETLGGKRGANQLAAVMNNIDRVKDIYKTSLGSEGSAQREEEAYEKSIQFSIDKAKAQIQELSANFLSSDLLKGLIESANVFLGILNNIVSTLGTVGTAIAGLGGMSIFKGTVLGNTNALVPQFFRDIVGIGARSREQNSIASIFSEKGSAAVVNKLKEFSSVEAAGSILKNVKGIDDVKKLEMLKEAFTDVKDGAAESALAADKAFSSFSAINKLKGTKQTLKDLGSGFASIIKDIWKNHKGFGVAGLVAGAAIGIYTGVKAYKNNLKQQGQEGAKQWESSAQSLQSYIDKYKELQSQLSNGDLSQEQQLQIKQQIYDLQSQIVEQYGAAAQGVDLVNGELEKQLSILNSISQQEAEKNLRENKKAYKDALKEMGNPKDITLTYYDDDDREIVEKLSNYAKSIEGLTQQADDDVIGISHLVWDPGVDVEGAADKIKSMRTYLDSLRTEYKNDEGALNTIDYLSSQLTQGYDTIMKKADEYGEAAKAAVETLISSQIGSESANNLKKASQNLTTALLDGQGDAIEKAYPEYQAALAQFNKDAEAAVNSNYGQQIGATMGHFETLRNELTAGFDETMMRQYYMTDALRATQDTMDDMSKTNPYKSLSKVQTIEKHAKAIKEAGLDMVDVQDIFDQGIHSTAVSRDLFALAQDFGIVFKDNIPTDQALYQNFLNALSASGVVFNSTSSSVQEVSSSITDFADSMQTAISNIGSLTSIISESVSGTGLSKDSLEMFRSIFGADADSALERTANGIHINMEALQKLSQEKGLMIQGQYLDELDKQLDLYAQKNQEIAQQAELGKDTSGLEAQREQIKENINAIKDLISQYQGATSAYNTWVQAKSAGSERDMYEQAFGAYESYGKQLQRGITDNGLGEWLHFMTGMSNYSAASLQDYADEYNRIGEQVLKGTSNTLADFYKLNKDGEYTKEGVDQLWEAINQGVSDQIAHKNESGEWEIDLSNDNIQKILDTWNGEDGFGKMGEGLLEAMIHASMGMGYTFKHDADMGPTQSAANTARKYLRDHTGSDYKFSQLDLDNLKTEESIKEGLDLVNKYLNSKDKTSEGEQYANTLKEWLVGKREEFLSNNEPHGDHNKAIENQNREAVERQRFEKAQKENEARLIEEQKQAAIEQLSAQQDNTSSLQDNTAVIEAMNGLLSSYLGTQTGDEKNTTTTPSTPDASTQGFKEDRMEPKVNAEPKSYKEYLEERPTPQTKYDWSADDIEDLNVREIKTDSVTTPNTSNTQPYQGVKYESPIGPTPDATKNFLPSNGYYPDGTPDVVDKSVADGLGKIIDKLFRVETVEGEEGNGQNPVDITTDHVTVDAPSIETGEPGLVRKNAMESGTSPFASYGSSFQDWISQKPIDGEIKTLTSTTNDLGESQEDAADEAKGLSNAISLFGGSAERVGSALTQSSQRLEEMTPTTSTPASNLSPTTPTGHKSITPTSSDSSTWQPSSDTEVHTLVKYDVDKSEVEAATAEAEQPVEQPVEQTVTTTINTELGTSVDTSNILPEDTSATIDVNANVEGTEDVDALNTAVDETEGKKVDVKANVAGEPQVRSLISAISSLSGKIVPVVANTGNSISQVRDLAAQINSLPPSRTITITTIQQTINKGSTAKAGAVNGTAHAMGTAHAKGKWGLEEDENNALINEVGEEIVVILLATLHGDVYVKSYLIAGKSLESYKLQHNHEIWVSVNV